MKIAVLAWGSLIWDRRELAIKEGFRLGGPRLPVEFCRVSGGGRLTLVIDDVLGSPCETFFALSAFGDLDAAIENLQIRECMPSPTGVGFIDTVSGGHSDTANKRHPQAVATIKAWAQASGYDAAVWTALNSNFHDAEEAAEPFSVEAAIHYLKSLDAPKLDDALHYIRSAPCEVRTPVRNAVSAQWPPR